MRVSSITAAMPPDWRNGSSSNPVSGTSIIRACRPIPDHELARRQQRGYGAIVTLELEGGHDAVRAFCSELICFSLAESLGGVESLIAHPATMTHAAMDPAARLKAGLVDGLIRLSIGIEAFEDLQADLAAGLERAAAARPDREDVLAAAC